MAVSDQSGILAPTGLLPDRVDSFADQLRANVARSGDKAALVCVEDGRTLTWRQLADLCARVARFLEERGIGANDRVAVLGENSIETLILYYGVQARGATWCTVHVEVNSNHLVEMVERIAPRLVLWQDDLDLGAAGIEAAGDATVDWIAYGQFDAADSFFSLLPVEAGEIVPVNQPEDRCVISFTSGTSAQPKGVLHSFCNYQAIAQHQLDRWEMTADDRVLEFRSFSWASAHMLSLNPVALAGATLIFAKNFSRSRFVAWLTEYRPTIVIAVPAVINMLLEDPPSDASSAFDSVRFVSCSTAPLMPDAHKRFEEIYGVELVQLYGMSEGGVVAANRPGSRRIGSVGTPGLYQDLRILDPEGEPLPAGDLGEIVTISAQHAHAYLHAGGTLEPIRGGALPTGDLGYIDEDGFVHVTGRAKDVIIRGGVNISPLEIDAVLSAHQDVVEAACFGIPDPVYGESVAGWVTQRAGANLTVSALADFCAERLPEAKRPTVIEIVKELPRNDRGKIDRNAISAAHAALSEKP
ncbi:MAG: acyl-CoA synthetase (AMP-forming)/AMP-acid ligase II [Alphaproteobacteria bacterium]